MRVLVVDDYEHIRDQLAALLEGLGAQVDVASNGLEALDKLRVTGYDVLFTDIVMPEMDGFELVEEVRELPRFNHLPIVMVSTHQDASYAARALRLGADDYVTKPAEKHVLARVLARVGLRLDLGAVHG